MPTDAWPGGRVVEPGAPPVQAFQHHEMVEVPEHDHREPICVERVDLQAHALRRQARSCARPAPRCWPCCRRARRRRRCAIPRATHGARNGAARCTAPRRRIRPPPSAARSACARAGFGSGVAPVWPLRSHAVSCSGPGQFAQQRYQQRDRTLAFHDEGAACQRAAGQFDAGAGPAKTSCSRCGWRHPCSAPLPPRSAVRCGSVHVPAPHC